LRYILIDAARIHRLSPIARKKGCVMRLSQTRMVPIFFMLLAFGASPAVQAPAFRVLVLAENDQYHTSMAVAGRAWIEKMGADSNFAVDTIKNLDSMSPSFLSKYQLIFQLNWWAFRWNKTQEAAFEQYIAAGNGWIGMHAALLCHAVPKPDEDNWTWYRDFIGGVNFVQHPAFQKATVIVEDRTHPVTKGLSATFSESDEWYEFDKNPRQNVRVLARVDESTYSPINRAAGGDHPEIWTNEKYPRTLVIAMGHSPDEFIDPNFSKLLRNAVMWAGRPVTSVKRPGSAVENGPRLTVTSRGRGIMVSVLGGGRAALTLTDARGRTVFDGISDNAEFRIDHAGFGSGVYLARIQRRGGDLSARFSR
jgi:type 1 glutamine amidotransferase